MKRRFPKLAFYSFILLASFLLACGDGSHEIIVPSNVTLTVSQKQQFSVSGTGSITWFVNSIEGGNATVGTISASGLYTAPDVPPKPNATSVAARIGGTSSRLISAVVTIINPSPEISAISPATAIAGSSGLALTITGSGFARQSKVTLGDTELATNFVSPAKLTASIASSLIASPGVLDLVVTTPAPGGGTSSSRAHTVLPVGVVLSTDNPQVAKYSFTSPVDASVTIEFGLDTGYGLRTWSLRTPPGGQVDVLVAGMRAFTTYHLRAIVELPDGVTHLDADHTFTTGGLPPDQIPSMTVTRSSSLTPQPGVQLLDLLRTRPVVTDLDGNIIWFYEGTPNLLQPLGFLPNGNFLVIERSPSAVREVDLAGNTVRVVNAADLDQALIEKGMEPISIFHHDAIMLPNNHLLLATYHFRTFTDLVGFEGQAIDVRGDGLVELDENLEVVWVWSSFDHLDINRHPRGFPDRRGTFDWTHNNAITYSRADRNLLISPRNQHWVLKIDYQDGFGSGNILWRLGVDGDFTLLNGGLADWQYGQHYPIIVYDQMGLFRVAIFDNGINRATDESGTPCEDDPATPCFSRVVIFELDELMMTARVVWDDKHPFFSSFLGSIQVLENGNVLYNAGAVNGATNAIIREVTQTELSEVVWEINVAGYRSYRGFRLPSLYPGVQW